MVLFAHIGINYFLKPFHILIYGDIGVHIFFVLSGFLITTLLLKENFKTGSVSLKRFYIRRALRILPVAYLFLIVLIALNFYCHLGVSFLDFVASFLFFKNLPLKNEPFTAHFWSLAVEEQFYFIFPFLIVSNLNRYIIITLLFLIVVPVISILGFYHATILFNNPVSTIITKIIMYSFWKGPLVILIGSFFAILLFKGMIDIKRIKDGYFGGFLLLSGAVIISTPVCILYNAYLSAYLAAILIGWAIVLSLKETSLLAIILNNTILKKIGIISYSVYIWQELFIGLRPWQIWMRAFQNYPIWLLIMVKLLLVFTIACISYYSFELKFLKIKNRYK